MSILNIPCPSCGSVLKVRDRSLLGRKGKCPKCSHTFLLEAPDEVVMELAASKSPAAEWSPTAPAATPAALPQVPSAASDLIVTAAAGGGLGRLRERQKRSAKRKWVNLAVGLFVVSVAGGVGAFAWMNAPSTLTKSAGQGRVSAAPNHGQSTGKTDVSGFGLAASPTKGEPVLLEMVPAGPRVILHLRPAELWAPDSLGEEFRFCLGPVGQFLETQITAVCQRPPQDIEELLLAWIPGQRGTPPELTSVVRLKTEAKKSELLEALGGERIDAYGRPVYVNNGRAAIIVDLKTYAIAPESMAEEMVSAVGGQNPLPAGIEDLIRKSDRTRHITLLFEPTAVLLDKEFLAPANAQTLLTESMDWFGDDAETVLWSAHFDTERFYSELLVRTSSGIRPAALEERLTEKLGRLANDLVATIKYMQPAEVGKRQLIGRMPAMAKVYAMATVADHDGRHVRLVTPLPDRAAPNLALGTLLAWDESTRTDFNRQLAPPPSATPTNLPNTVAERLKQKIDVDFRRTPLQEAFAYISDEAKFTIDIDGDALKLSGYTQNMPQTFKLDKISAAQAILEILKNYDKMCVLVDEAKSTLTVSTIPVVEQKGLTPFKLTP